MTKKTWAKPELRKILAGAAEAGNKINVNPDGTAGQKS